MLDLEKVSEEVRASEPGTVQYQITQSDEDENEILIWEEVSPNLPPPHSTSLLQGIRADIVPVQEQR